MKKHILIFAAAFTITACGGKSSNEITEQVVQRKAATEITAETFKAGFNAELAKELGADAYGMRSYVFVTIKTGPNDATITDEAERAELFKGHFENMGKWAEDGKLVLAGPFMDAPPKRGLFIFDVASIEEAQELVKDDPTVAAGIFELEFTKYYGSAALKKVNEIHGTIQEKDM